MLKDMLHVASPEELGKGFDVQNELQQKYTELEFVQAWKIVNDDRTRRYDASKQLISTQCDDFRASGIKVLSLLLLGFRRLMNPQASQFLK